MIIFLTLTLYWLPETLGPFKHSEYHLHLKNKNNLEFEDLDLRFNSASLPFLLPYWRGIAEARPELSLLGDGDH